jgi:predicted MFS family arabinose efflux permease
VVKTHAEESLGANPGDAALNPADSVAMGVPSARSHEPVPPPSRGTFRALRHPAFRLLFVAFMVNQTGFWVSHISLQGLMVELSNNDTRQNGLLFFALFVPAFLLAPLAGVAADRFDRKRIVLCCYLMVATVSGVLAVLTGLGQMTPGRLLTIAACMGISFAFSGPASSAIAANAVPMEDLASAVSIQSAANNLTRVAGPIVASPFVATGRYELSFAVYLVAALAAASLTAAMRLRAYVPDDEETGIWSRMRSGFVHARERRPSLAALSTIAMLSFFGVSHVVLMPAYAEEILGSKDWFAWLVVATGFGAMIGALRTGNAATPVGLSRAARGLVGYGVMLVLFAFTSLPVVALGAQAVIGYFYFAVMTRLQTLIQQIVDESKRGRVMSLFQVAWAGLVPFGSLSMGFLAGPIGTRETLAAGAVVCIAYGVAMTLFARRYEPS